jgi:hypothetical protein
MGAAKVALGLHVDTRRGPRARRQCCRHRGESGIGERVRRKRRKKGNQYVGPSLTCGSHWSKPANPPSKPGKDQQQTDF